jgi:predicted glycosyltransferase
MKIKKKTLLFYLSHPALFHLYKQTIRELGLHGHRVYVLVKKKEVLEELAEDLDCRLLNIYPRDRGTSPPALLCSVLIKDYRIFRIARKIRPDLLIGTASEVSHVGKLLRIPSIIVNDTDCKAAPLFARSTYPFADTILAPQCCDVGRWADRSITYPGCHPSAYLHPAYFTPDAALMEQFNPSRERYFVLRLVKLAAHHDQGKSGITDELALEIIRRLEPHGRIYISSERDLPAAFDRYVLRIAARELHSALAFADLLITDGQTVAAEAAALGTPAIAYNGFIGIMGYLVLLENNYHLLSGIRSGNPEQLLTMIDKQLSSCISREEWHKWRNRLLAESTDIPRFLTWFIETYPDSEAILRTNPQKINEFLFGA